MKLQQTLTTQLSTKVKWRNHPIPPLPKGSKGGFVAKNGIIIKSPAKVNLTLNVISKRKDGYHELETIMVPISLWDDLEIHSIDRLQIKILSDNKELPLDKRNIINKAIKLLWEEAGEKRGVMVKLKKNIPISAGLGGGSSNGASILLALNKLWRINLSTKRLIELGTKLGADVPFFILRKPALAKGIGEKIYPIKIKRRFWSVIINPEFPVSTAWVYRNFNFALTKKSKNNNKIISYLKLGRSPALWSIYLGNDLEGVTLKKFPVLLEIKKAFMEAGALNALMAGSGPSIFGVFASRERAIKAYINLKRKSWGKIFLVRNL